MNSSTHAAVRAQQRCIPPIIDQWLDEFGEEHFDGHGGAKRFFSHQSVARMKRAFGSQFVRHNAKYLRVYRVENSHTGAAITRGWRIRPMHRR